METGYDSAGTRALVVEWEGDKKGSDLGYILSNTVSEFRIQRGN